MKQIGGAAAIGVAMLIGSGLSAPSAQAGYIATLEEVGTSVVATGSGTIDVVGLNSLAPGGGYLAQIAPIAALMFVGASMGDVNIYTGFTGPVSFGSGGSKFADSATGDAVGIVHSTDILVLPGGYSGTLLSDTATYNNANFSSLGVIPGTYEWTWGSGANQNFTLEIGPAAVPAPLIGRGLPILLAVGGILFGAKLLERGKRHRLQFG